MAGYFAKITFEGLEHLPSHGPCVLASKHYSRWDPIVLGALLPGPLWFMTNANQFSGIQGWLIQRVGAFPVDLAKPQLASLRKTVELLQQKEKLVIFPEGGIVRDQPLRDLKPGLARLVLQAERTASPQLSIPIVPIALHYNPTAGFRSSLTVKILPPLYSRDFEQGGDKQTAQALTVGLEAALRQGLAELNSPNT
jgi:1-acyl-sn-glycerol-3-phosphate acyltransferase